MSSILYYEIVHPTKSTIYIRYPIDRTRSNHRDDYMGPTKLSYRASRIWEWNPATDDLKFIKNIIRWEIIKPCPREFLTVQLKAQETVKRDETS